MPETTIKFEACYLPNDNKHQSKNGFNSQNEAWDYVAQQICDTCKNDFKNNLLLSFCGAKWQLKEYN